MKAFWLRIKQYLGQLHPLETGLSLVLTIKVKSLIIEMQNFHDRDFP